MIGIYKITNPENKVYIGQSINIERRIQTYKTLNCEGTKTVYDSLIKHGVEKHKFEILCECSVKELNDKERYYQDLYDSSGKNGLNKILTKTTSERNKTKEIELTTKKLFKSKGKNKIYYPPTREYFNTAMELYRAHSDKFISYQSLSYKIKKNQL